MKASKKHFASFLASLTLVGLLSSCYATTTCVGSMNADEPAIKVNTVKNHFLLGGLIPIAKTDLQDSKYVGQAKAYKVKKSITFLDGLLQCITFGLYSPSTTTYYIPGQIFYGEERARGEAPARTEE